MFTGTIDAARLRKSVLSVPPLARDARLGLAREANGALLAHLRGGGVTTFMYGGNANLYNVGVREYAALLDMLEGLAEADDWVIPSVGADFGKALDQVEILKDRAFPTAMVLPLRFPATSAGMTKGVSLLAERYGRPVIFYVKDEGFTTPQDVAALMREGAVCAVKYAIVRSDPREDSFLTALLNLIDPGLVISGIGERPVVDHARHFGLRAFTSGCVCIAPRLSTMIREAIQAGDFERAEKLRQNFLPLEDLRDAHSPLRVLHEAVRLAGVAETGPILPFLSNIADKPTLAAIEAAAAKLRGLNDQPALLAAE